MRSSVGWPHCWQYIARTSPGLHARFNQTLPLERPGMQARETRNVPARSAPGRFAVNLWLRIGYETGVATGVAAPVVSITVNSLYMPSSKWGLPVFGSGTLQSAR